ncbi:unnamed protein product [Closterium sp. Yama58-4]|nr:unnamed protein product [Closterium sp. Yama58-4]
MTSEIPWFKGMLINATFNDYCDGEKFKLECGRFLEAIKDHTEVNTLASGWKDLSRPPVWIDYREVLMHWAHAMGWVSSCNAQVEGGPYHHMYAQDVHVLFGQAFNQGRHLIMALPASGTVRTLHTRTQRQMRSRLSSPQPGPTEHAEEDLDGLSPRTRSMTELVASTRATQMPTNYAGGRGPPAAQPAGASDQRDADGAVEHGWAGEPMPQDLGAAHALIRRQDRERARLENQLRDYEARRRWAMHVK